MAISCSKHSNVGKIIIWSRLGVTAILIKFRNCQLIQLLILCPFHLHSCNLVMNWHFEIYVAGSKHAMYTKLNVFRHNVFEVIIDQLLNKRNLNSRRKNFRFLWERKVCKISVIFIFYARYATSVIRCTLVYILAYTYIRNTSTHAQKI